MIFPISIKKYWSPHLNFFNLFPSSYQTYLILQLPSFISFALRDIPYSSPLPLVTLFHKPSIIFTHLIVLFLSCIILSLQILLSLSFIKNSLFQSYLPLQLDLISNVCEEWSTLFPIFNFLPKQGSPIFFYLTSASITILCSLLEFLLISPWPHSLVFLSFHLTHLSVALTLWPCCPWCLRHSILVPCSSLWCFFLNPFLWHRSLVRSLHAAGSQVLYCVFFSSHNTFFLWVSTQVLWHQLPPIRSHLLFPAETSPLNSWSPFFKLSISKTEWSFSLNLFSFLFSLVH